MKIKLTELSEYPNRIQSEETAQTLSWNEPESPLNGPVTVAMTLIKDGHSVLAQGNATGSLKLLCSRCAEELFYPFRAKIDLEYVPGTEGPLPREAALDDQIAKRVYFKGPAIDLNEDIRQSLVLEIPIRPLCSTHCQGLCPVCKGNLGRKECQCKK